MSERPTPEELAEWQDGATGLYAAEQFLDRLETEGYVIVHPDDYANVYPLDVFPKLDTADVHAILQKHGYTLDGVSAHVARRLLDSWFGDDA